MIDCPYSLYLGCVVCTVILACAGMLCGVSSVADLAYFVLQAPMTWVLHQPKAEAALAVA